MKNLELLELQHKTPVGGFLEDSHVDLVAQTPEGIYFLRNDLLHLHTFADNETVQISSCPLSYRNIHCFKYLTFESKVCIVGENLNGHIELAAMSVLADTGEDAFRVVSLPEEIEDIRAASWNPTEEVVALVTRNYSVYTYSIDFEWKKTFRHGGGRLDSAVPLAVTTGWGSKDTQFRGSEGKLKAKPEQPVVLPSIKDTSVVISWRGNGEMFVVNNWDVAKKRSFVVFDVSCKALYRMEDCPGLQPPIAWRPAGNMIATVKEVSGKRSVVIFEKNGQERFSFELDVGEVVIKDIKWSPCAEILVIRSQDSTKEYLHLMTCSNYKWYEKQKLTFDVPLVDFEWFECTQSTYTLRVVTRYQVIKYTFRNTVSDNGAGIFGVINGRILQLTNFKDAIIPPTLYSKRITCKNSINFVAFEKDRVCAVDCDNNLKVYGLSVQENEWTLLGTDKESKVYNCEDLDNLELEYERHLELTTTMPLALHHFRFVDHKVQFYYENGESVYKCTVDRSKKEVVKDVAVVKQLTETIANKKSGDLDKYHMDQSNVLQLNKAAVVKQLTVTIAYKTWNFTLFSNCRFFVDDSKISDDVNSFIVFDDYLAFTTKLNQLFCVKLTYPALEDLARGDLTRSFRRSVEQGATIVSSVPDTPKVVLQMPRGNLETISLRLVSIDMLDRLLDQGQWEVALYFMRTEKLNANLLVDLNPDRFFSQIDKFISALKTADELTSICVEIEEENVLNTVYKNCRGSGTFPVKNPKEIFEKILGHLREVDYAPYVAAIMVINLRFFSLRNALLCVQDLMWWSDEESSPERRNSVRAAVKTLKTYGCEDDKLYNEALLLYDLDLAQMVAGCCQMDPGLYQPQIEKLRSLPELERRLEINVYAKKVKEHVAYLMRCPNIDSSVVLGVIEKHKVSRDAYEALPANSPHFRCVSKIFAEDLGRRGCHREAGAISKRAGLLQEALKEFKLGLRWREALDLMEKLGWGVTEKVRIVDELAAGLLQRQAVEDAAILYETYANNYEMAVKVLVDHCRFEKAAHLAHKYRRPDILASDIIPALVKHSQYLKEKVTELDETYNKHMTRLEIVRKLKVTNLDETSRDPDFDRFSEGGSTVSRSSRSSRSRSSTASSRNRKKEERKKQDLREGGEYEDIALVRALHGTIKEIYAKGEEVRTCCVLLLQESDVNYKDVKSLYDIYTRTRCDVRRTVGEIWPPQYQNDQLLNLGNFKHLDTEFWKPPTEPNHWIPDLF